MTHLHIVLDGAENGNFAACSELWKRYKAVRPFEADCITPPDQNPDAILTERQKAAMIEWAQREVAGQIAAARARQMNAELPANVREVMLMKGMME